MEKKFLNCEGIHMKNRKKTLLILVVLIFCSFLSACQPTPESKIVVEKRQEYEASSNNTTYQVEEAWNEKMDFFDGSLTFEIKASIMMPTNPNWNVIQVVDSKFIQNEVDHFSKVLFGSEEIYYSDLPATKAEIEQQIINIKKEIQMFDVENTEEIGSISNLEDTLKTLEKIYAEAPEKIDANQKASTSLRLTNEVEELAVNTKRWFGDNAYLRIQNNNDNDFGSILEYSNNIDGYGFETFAETDDQENKIKKVGISQDEAMQNAYNTLENLGITNYSCQKTDIAKRMADNKLCFLFSFTPNYNDIPSTLTYITSVNSDTNYAPYDIILVGISKDGLEKISWNGREKQTGFLTENPKLIPFEEIKGNFKKYVKVNYGYIPESEEAEDGLNKEETIELDRVYIIDRITLGYMRIKQKDTSNTYIVVPVWDFFGYSKFDNDGKAEISYLSLMTINALDGSHIDRQEGY